MAKALKGDLDAIKWVVDRTEGKVPERVEASVDARHEHAIPESTLDAVLAYYAGKRGGGGGPS